MVSLNFCFMISLLSYLSQTVNIQMHVPLSIKSVLKQTNDDSVHQFTLKWHSFYFQLTLNGSLSHWEGCTQLCWNLNSTLLEPLRHYSWKYNRWDAFLPGEGLSVPQNFVLMAAYRWGILQMTLADWTSSSVLPDFYS